MCLAARERPHAICGGKSGRGTDGGGLAHTHAYLHAHIIHSSTLKDPENLMAAGAPLTPSWGGSEAPPLARDGHRSVRVGDTSQRGRRSQPHSMWLARHGKQARWSTLSPRDALTPEIAA